MLDVLTGGLAQLGLRTEAAPRLAQFADEVLTRNRVINLTSITDPAKFASLHLLDSAAMLTVADFRGKKVVDVGTGAGFPGVPLRIIEPDFDLTLLDSLGKRIDFLREVCARLDLRRVEAVHARAEDFAAERREQYDIALSRAVAALNVLCELALPLVQVGGCFLAMKSVSSNEEIDGAKNAIGQLGGQIRQVRDYVVPGAGITHRVVVIDKVRPTPKQYPRTFARIKKSPL